MSGIVKSLFGKSSAEKAAAKYTPYNFTSPGLSGTLNKRTNTFSLTRSPEINTTLAGITRGLEGRSAAFAKLAGRVAPGFGELTRARVDPIRRAGERTVGNLRERFRVRRVLPSTFAQREIASTEALFAAKESEVAAETKIQEMALTAQFLDEQFGSAIQAFQTILDQFNFESTLAANVSTQQSSLMQKNIAVRGELAEMRRNRNADIAGTLLGFIPTGDSGGGG